MKIDFTLTLDQFVEGWNVGRPRSNSMRPFLSICVVVLLIAGGYSAAFPPSESPNVSRAVVLAFGRVVPLGEALILEMGLLLPFVVLRMWFVQNRRVSLNTKSSLKSLFEQFYSGPRTFQAEETNWQFTLGESQDMRSWGELTRVIKTANLFILQDLYKSYVLPEAAMTAEQRNALEALCKHALIPKKTLFSVGMIPPARDYVTVMMRSDWWMRPWQMLGFTAIGLASVCLFAYGIAERWPEIGYFSFIPLALLVPLFHAMQKYQEFLHYRPVCFHTAEIAEDRICFVIGTLQDVREIRVLQYRWLLKVRETRRVILLYFNPSRAFVVPKAGFGPTELKQFRELIHSHLSAVTKPTKFPG